MIVVTSYFNPCGYSSRRRNYEIFRDNLKAHLITVEVLFGDQPSQIDGEGVIRARTNSVMWQKEAALNIAISAIPRSEKFIAWLDCDVVFSNDDWMNEAERALRHGFELVQPFDTVARLPPIDYDSARVDNREVKRGRGFAAGLNYLGYGEYSGNIQLFYGDTGFAWAARADLLRKHKLYAANIIGGGDLSMCHAALASFHRYFGEGFFNEAQRVHLNSWANGFYRDVEKRITHVPGTIFHLYHGELVNRGYNTRHEALLHHRFNPYSDISINNYGLWEWASHKPEMQKLVSSYFLSRQEDK